MNFSKEEIRKLEILIKEKYKILQPKIPNNNHSFCEYCTKHNITMIHPSWVKEILNEKIKNVVCINNVEEDDQDSCQWLLVPNELAKKVLMLKGFP